MVVHDPKAELTLDELWKDAQDRFENITKQRLRASSVKRLDDVIKELDAKYIVKSSEDATIQNRTKRAVHNVLQCIQLLGGIAAQGASIVFGPANLCFNAVSYIIDIPGKISKIYLGIGYLFEEIYAQLNVFKVYRRIEASSSIDPELLDSTHRLMISIVNICALSYKLIDGGKLVQIKAGLKAALFDDDSGVHDELVKLERLTKAQSVVTGAITLEHVLSTEKGLGQLLASQCESAEKLSNIREGVEVLVTAENDRRMERVTKEQIRKIAKRLKIESNLTQEHEKTLAKISKGTVPGSGEWLWDCHEFRNWIDPESEVNPLLLISGTQQSGKSYLLSVIIDELESARGEAARNKSRISIAYYFFSKRDEKTSRDGQLDQNSIETALKCMCLQIAAKQKGYAKDMAGICDSSKDSDFQNLSCGDLWNSLKLGSPRGDVTQFLLFDGLDQLSETDAGQLFKLLSTQRQSPAGFVTSKPERSRLRILATGSSKMFNMSVSLLLPIINIKSFNASDISKFIDHELENDEIMQARSVEMMDLTRSIRTKLHTKAQGDFSIVKQKLERIKSAVEADASLDDIEDILEEDHEQDIFQIAQDVINDLSKSLNVEDIKQLNELFIWSINAQYHFTISELRAALVLRSRKSPLRQIERKIKSKYAKIFEVEDDGTVRINWQIEDFLESSKSPRASTASTDVSGTPKITMTISISNAGLDKVQQFLWDLSEKAAFERFPFKASETVQEKGTLRVNYIDANLVIASACLDLLADEPDEKTNSLVWYALECLSNHLAILMSFGSNLEPLEKQGILKGLLTVLVDTDAVEKHWTSGSGLRRYWLDNDYDVDSVEYWLNDTTAALLLEPRDRRDLKRLLDESVGYGGFWKDVTIRMSRHWLQLRRSSAREAYDWVDGFLAMQQRGAHHDKKHVINEDEGEVDASEKLSIAVLTNVDLVSRAAQWTQKVLNIYEPDSLWYERLGETYLALEEFDPALASFDKARNVNNSHWKLGEGFAQAYAGKKDFQAAIREIQPVLTTFRGQKVLEPNEKDEFVHDLLLVARWQEKLNNLENAISLYVEALEINPFDSKACFDMLKALRLAQNDSCARDFFAKTYEEKSGKNKFNRLANLLFFAAIDTEEAPHSRFNTLTELTYQTESFEIIRKAFKDALEIAGESKDVHPQGCLLLYLGVVIARQASDAGAMKAALDCWGKTCGILRSTQWVNSHVRSLAAQFLNTHHFQQAIDLWDGTKDPQIHPERLKEILNDSASGSARLSLNSSTFLGSYYLRTDQIHKTKDLYLNPMKDALDMLSDDDLENDSDGYAYLADILLHTGDDVNALSAWSLVTPHDCARFDDPRTPAPGSSQADSPTAELLDTIAPKTNNGDNPDVETRLADDLVNSDPGPNDGAMEPQKERTGDIYLECMGNCDKVWTFADDMWCCKYCPDTVFCRDCRQKVEDHKLERYWCHAGHDWLFVPPWSDEEFHRIGRGRVRIEGDIVNGKRIGGRIVKIKEWLNTIRTDWGIEIPEEWREEVPDGMKRSDLKS